MASTFYGLRYHIGFSTKDRRPFIQPGWWPRLHEYLGGTVLGNSFATAAGISCRSSLCTAIAVLCVLAIQAFSGNARSQSLSAQEIAETNRQTTEQILTSASYAFRIHARKKDDPTRDYTVDHVLRRDGDAFFHLELDADPSAAAPDAHTVVRVHAFDGKILRENEFAYAFADSLLHPGERGGRLLDFFERAISADRIAPINTYSSRPGRKPFGLIAEGLRFRLPGDLLNDQYALAAFAVPRMHPPIYYHRILSDLDSEVIREDGDLITFKCLMSPTPDELMALHPELTRQLAERIYRRWEATLTFDIGRGCQVTSAVIYDHDAGVVARELSDVKLVQDPDSGVWYPASYSLVSSDGYSFNVAIQSMSFAPVAAEVFSEVFFNQQPIDDEINKQSARFLLRPVEDYHEDAYFSPDRDGHEELLRIARDEVLTGADIVVSAEDIPELSEGSGNDDPPAPPAAQPPARDLDGRWIQWLGAVGIVLLAAVAAIATMRRIRARRP